LIDFGISNNKRHCIIFFIFSYINLTTYLIFFFFIGCIANMLTILLNHRACLCGPHMAYIEGKVHNMGDVDLDHLTLIDTISAITELGYKDTGSL
jgi:hypothetical protein